MRVSLLLVPREQPVAPVDVIRHEVDRRHRARAPRARRAPRIADQSARELDRARAATMDRHVRFERRAGVRAIACDRRVAEEPAAERVVLAVQGRVEDVGDGGFERAARRRLRRLQPHARAVVIAQIMPAASAARGASAISCSANSTGATGHPHEAVVDEAAPQLGGAAAVAERARDERAAAVRVHAAARRPRRARPARIAATAPSPADPASPALGAAAIATSAAWHAGGSGALTSRATSSASCGAERTRGEEGRSARSRARARARLAGSAPARAPTSRRASGRRSAARAR